MAAPMRSTVGIKGRKSTSSLRRLASFGPVQAQISSPLPSSIDRHLSLPLSDLQSPPSSTWEPRCRRDLSRTFFDDTGVLWSGNGDRQPPDPNKAKLGKTLRILQERLPTLLQYPLPQDILAPNICLHLFPSTHPHLPTVSGRVAYSAALWTSPIAWNRVPLVGNVKLEILAERMTSEPVTFLPRRPGAIDEQLVVRWKEKCKGCAAPNETTARGVSASLARSLRIARGVEPDNAFTGLFIFDFDSEGRLLTHTIEHAQEGGDWEKGMGAKVVGLTDWLLGGMRNPGDAPIPLFEGIKK